MKKNQEEDQDQSKNNGSDTVDRKLYMTPKMRQDMDTYVETKGYKSWNDMMRTAYIFLKQVDPVNSESEEKPTTITDRLSSIESKLDELSMLKEKLELEKEIKKEKTSHRELYKEDLIEESETEITNYEEIRKAIIKELKESPNHEMKEFVLIPYLRKSFSEEAIWITMLRMEQDKEIKFLDEEVIKLLEK